MEVAHASAMPRNGWGAVHLPMTIIERVIEIVEHEPGITQRIVLRRLGASASSYPIVLAVRAGRLQRVKIRQGHALYPVGVDMPEPWTRADYKAHRRWRERHSNRMWRRMRRRMRRRREIAVDELAGVIVRTLRGRGRVPVHVLLAKVRLVVGFGPAPGRKLAELVRAGLVAVFRDRDGRGDVALVARDPARET